MQVVEVILMLENELLILQMTAVKVVNVVFITI